MIERIFELSSTDYRDLIRETARDMGSMFFRTPPQWEDVLTGLSELETRINKPEGNSTINW